MSSKMYKQDYIDYIKLELSGGLLELEIEDEVIGKFIDASMVELRRFYDQPNFITVPFARCIDLKDFDHSSIVTVRRAQAINGDSASSGLTGGRVDPMYAQQWAAFSSGGYMYNLQNYVLNYLSYNTLLQMQNTTSTDMAFIEDKHEDKLYINCLSNIPQNITIEYIPVLTNVEQITSDYWIDILKQLSIAQVKIALGRIRTRFTQTNALWTQDGESMLQEGNEELKALRELLRTNKNMFVPRD